ncbi:hypothetical protein ABIA32_000527 [Streptacidiphilus sp. MAP12-20]
MFIGVAPSLGSMALGFGCRNHPPDLAARVSSPGHGNPGYRIRGGYRPVYRVRGTPGRDAGLTAPRRSPPKVKA